MSRAAAWFSIPWYPFALSAYPVLYLLSFNIGQVDLADGVRPLLATILMGALLFGMLFAILRDKYRAAFLAALWLTLFFAYGHLFNLLTAQFPDARLWPWVPAAWVLLFAASAVWATRPGFSFRAPVPALNAISLTLAAVSLGQIVFSAAPRTAHAPGAENAPIQEDLVLPQDAPDVYFFLLDSYARADLLEQAYGYDNSDFVRGLEERGFYVARCSQSNYVRTELSLTSTLNMAYLQGLDPQFVPENIRRLTLWDSLKHSAARYNFESLGYKTVSFASGYAFVELNDADLFLSPPPLSSGLTEFEALYLRTTLARHLEDMGWLDADAIIAQNFRDRFEHVFNSLHDLARMPEPTFAYIHLISPHPPFVFGPDGEHTHPAEFWNERKVYPGDLYAQGYQNQLTYLNRKMLSAVDTLLEESASPPVIIIQGDHGPWLQPREKRFSILSAYYMPGHEEMLYPKISPVNNFRMIFNAYFGGRYPPLADISYFSPVPELYEFSEVQNTCR